jgi:uncharacterized protein
MPSPLYISLAMNDEAARLISALGLAPLPGEGGFYASTWTSAATGPDGRACGSSIVFLITETDFSALHRLQTDEIWNFHAGDPAELVLLDPASGVSRVIVLGPDVPGGHVPQAVAPAGQWQGARVAAGGLGRGWSLFGCSLAPAWDPREFELGNRASLESDFPACSPLIRALTR